MKTDEADKITGIKAENLEDGIIKISIDALIVKQTGARGNQKWAFYLKGIIGSGSTPEETIKNVIRYEGNLRFRKKIKNVNNEFRM